MKVGDLCRVRGWAGHQLWGVTHFFLKTVTVFRGFKLMELKSNGCFPGISMEKLGFQGLESCLGGGDGRPGV